MDSKERDCLADAIFDFDFAVAVEMIISETYGEKLSLEEATERVRAERREERMARLVGKN